MQINVNLHLTHGISRIQVINLALNMQRSQQNNKKYKEITQNEIKVLRI